MGQPPMRTPTCPVCLDLLPNHLPTTPWRINVTDSMLLESCLRFKVSDLETSSRNCVTCSIVREGLEKLSNGVLQGELSGLRSRDGSLIVRNNFPLEVEILGEDVSVDHTSRVQFFSQEDNRGSNIVAFGTASNIAASISSQSHSDLIKSWVERCIQTHEACGPKPDSGLPTRLLDIAPRPDLSVNLIETKDLENLHVTPSYATLSHCWGVKKFLRTLSTNISHLKECISFESLPRTFEDAISVARELGVGYIWIDSLCIIQDSSDDWKRESRLMASIYSNSYLNIAATLSGDSSETFLSNRDKSSKSVAIKPHVLEATDSEGGSYVMARPAPTHVHDLFSTPSQNMDPIRWDTTRARLLSRAWVFQERHLAPRTLHFHHSELVLECRSGLRCECTGLDHFTTNPLRNFDDMSFASWYGVVEVFSQLRLTYQNDRLDALTGVAEVFGEKLACAYLKGLWSGDMARGLLWNVTHYGSAVSEKVTKRQFKIDAPTWSWASLVLAEGNKIFFPVSDDPSFSVNKRFELLHEADPPESPPPATSQSQDGAITISCLFQDGVMVAGEDETSCIGVMLFQEDIDDMVMISRQSFVMDIEKQSIPNECWDVSYLLLGSSKEERFEDAPSTTLLRLLVVRPSIEIEGSWERIGVMDVEEDVGSCRELSEGIFRLV